MTLHHDAARVRERLGQIDKAEELYRAILRLRSDDPVALKRRRGDLPRRSSAGRTWPTSSSSAPAARPSRCRTGPERRARLRELAGLYEERLETPYEAIDTLERLAARVGRRGARRRRAAAASEETLARARGAGPALLARGPVGQGGREPAGAAPI